MARAKMTSRRAPGGKVRRPQCIVGSPRAPARDRVGASDAARRNRTLASVFALGEDWTVADARARERAFLAECDDGAWTGLTTYDALEEHGLFTAVVEAGWHELCRALGVDEDERAAYGPWRYVPGRISHEAVPWDDFDEMYWKHKAKGLVDDDLIETLEDEGDEDEYVTTHAKLSRDDVASLLEEYGKRYLFLIVREFEGADHVAAKSLALDANMEYVRHQHEQKSAHPGVPMARLLDPKELSFDEIKAMYKAAGLRAGKNAKRESLLRELVIEDRALELDAYGKAFAKVVKRLDVETKKLQDKIEKAVNKAVKSVIIDKWDTDRKNDFLATHDHWSDERKKAWHDGVASRLKKTQNAKKAQPKTTKAQPKTTKAQPKTTKAQPKTTKAQANKPAKPKRKRNDPLVTSDFAVGMELYVRGAKGETWHAEVTKVRPSNAKCPIEVAWLVKQSDDAYVYWDCAHRDVIDLRTILETHAPGHFPAGTSKRARCVACEAAKTTCAKRAKT
jgi:hypothetical protein